MVNELTDKELATIKEVLSKRRLTVGPGSVGPVGPLIGNPHDEALYLMTEEGWVPVSMVETEDGGFEYYSREVERNVTEG